MRLLQLALGSDTIIDLHPLVSVVSGLSPDDRRRLSEVVVGLARGTAEDPRGLLEAEGVLFDLSTEMLDLLDLEADDLQPVVTAADLPSAGHDPARRERAEVRGRLAAAEARSTAARDARLEAEAALTAATDALQRAREARAEVTAREAEAATAVPEVAEASAERRRLEERRADSAARAEEASARRAASEAAAADVRARLAEAGARRQELVDRLEHARARLEPGVDAAAERAAAALAQVEAEMEAHQQAHGRAVDDHVAVATEPGEPPEPPTERLERVERQIDDLEKRLAAFGPVAADRVAEALAMARPPAGAVFETMPAAAALADELEALDAVLAVRNPELDRDTVNQLEQSHAELLDAIDKADSRFGGARAQRRVEALREVENSLLNELGFTSYSDYMIGYSLLHVDTEKEAALDAARTELAGAEDHWQSLQAEADAELARAEAVERRRALLDRARALLGRAVAPETVIEELRNQRVEVDPAPFSPDGLRGALDEVGVVLGDDDLDREDLFLVAEAWLAESSASAGREQAAHEELRALRQERDEVQQMIERGPIGVPAGSGSALGLSLSTRLGEARELFAALEKRQAAHREAEQMMGMLTADLADAEEAERLAREAVAGPEDDVARATSADEVAQAGLREIDEALAAAAALEAAEEERLRALAAKEPPPVEEDTEAILAAAEAAAASAQAAAARAAEAARATEAERLSAATAVEALGSHHDDDDDLVAEEIEWYILARLAAQRSVSLAGSLPLLLDDALNGLGEEELSHLLGRLERMAQAVQIIVVSDDPSAASWALRAGGGRAAVVHPQPI
jgi:hypothetical protein